MIFYLMKIKLNYQKPYIDFHTHIFPEKLYAAIKEWFVKNVNWHFDFQGSSQDAMKFLDNIPNLEKFIAFGYAHKPDISMKLNEFYAKLKLSSKKVVALGCVHQDDQNIVEVAETALKEGLSGFKIHCQVQKVSPFDKRFFPLYEILSEQKFFILFHAGTAPFPAEFTGFSEFYKFLKKFPRVRSVVAHLGAFESELFLKAALDYENLYLDTSYAFIPNPTNKIDAATSLLIEAQDKIVFGSDFPGICHSYESAVNAITTLNLNENCLEKLFYINAKKLLNQIN